MQASSFLPRGGLWGAVLPISEDAPRRADDNRLRAPQSRAGLACQRLGDVLLQGLLGALVVILASRLFYDNLIRFLELPVEVLALLGTIGALLAVRRGVTKLLTAIGWRHFAFYSPLWIGGVFGAGLVLLAIGVFPDLLPTNHALLVDAGYLLGLGGFGVLGGLGLACCSLCTVRRNTGIKKAKPGPRADEPETAGLPKPSDASHTINSFEALRHWLQSDTPILRAEDDLFEHRPIAQRIAKRLLDDEPPAQAVVGRLGSGKTSLATLVEDELARGTDTKHVRLVRVELWPFETPSAAVEGVIGELVDALATEVSVAALRGLPSTYSTIMSNAGGLWSALSQIHHADSNPRQSLVRFDKIAWAIGVRFVLWIEDLERFAGAGAVESKSESPEEAERLAPIRALLHGLDHLRSVSVITATTSLVHRFDLEKIARHVVALPILSPRASARLLGTFRAGCLGSYDFVDPAAFVDGGGDQGRKALDRLLEYADYIERSSSFNHPVVSLEAATLALCSTPRTLKQGLRRCLEAWVQLTGEIDFDDLLLMSLLREASPDAFAILREHADALRAKTDDNKSLASSRQRWSDELARLGLPENTRAAIAKVVEFCFWGSDKRLKPQSVAHRTPIDYWRRFLVLPVLGQSDRDQPVIRTLLGDSDAAILDLLDRDADSLPNFALLVAPDRLRGLLSQLVTRRAKENPEAWPEAKPPGLLSLWHMWWVCRGRADWPETEMLQEIMRALEIGVPASLALAVRLHDHFASPGDRQFRLLADPDSRRQARTHALRLMVDHLDGNPAALTGWLHGSATYDLFGFCWQERNLNRNEATVPPFEEWSALAPTLLDAARHAPELMLPRLALFVVGLKAVRPSMREPEYEFLPGNCAVLFGSQEAVLSLYSNDVAQTLDNALVKTVAKAALAHASAADG